MRLLLLLSLPLLLSVCLLGCNGERRERKRAAEDLARFVESHFRAYFLFYPSRATEAGFHEYDAKLEDYSAGSIRARIATLSEELARLSALRRRPLPPTEEIDAALLDGAIRSELLWLETLRALHRNPILYVTLPGSSADSLIKRNFAPPPERLRSLVSRMRAVPSLLEAMQNNIQDAPPELVSMAARLARNSVDFLGSTVYGWAMQAAANDIELRREADQVILQAARAMHQAAEWLQQDLLPRCKGSFSIGAENLSRLLLYEEMIDIPLDRLLAIAEQTMEKDRQAFLDLAGQVAPGKSPYEVMRLLSDAHPGETSLIEEARRDLESLRSFVLEHNLVEIPSQDRPRVEPTPPYARAAVFAMMDTPGPFEQTAREAFYYVTPPDPSWPRGQKEEHLRLFNRYTMRMIGIHEVWPGHYLQFLYLSQVPTMTRKLVRASTNVEGWAHYAEQMLVEEGFGAGDPYQRLAQLAEALLRDCRFVAAIRMHAHGMSVDQAARLFVEQAFAEKSVALEEARRGAYDPTYLVYTLGKLMLYKLREDYRARKGSGFSLREFHTAFLRQGPLPFPLMRRLLLGQTSAPLL